MPDKATVAALEPADFVILALLAVVILFILPRRLLHYVQGPRADGGGPSGPVTPARRVRRAD